MTEQIKESMAYQAIRDKAIAQLRSGQSLTGEGGVFAPLLKEFLESALEAEMEAHLDSEQRELGNKRNGKGSKILKTTSGNGRLSKNYQFWTKTRKAENTNLSLSGVYKYEICPNNINIGFLDSLTITAISSCVNLVINSASTNRCWKFRRNFQSMRVLAITYSHC